MHVDSNIQPQFTPLGNTCSNTLNDDFSLSMLQLDFVDRIVHRVADKRDSIQKKTFTKWINKYLAAINGRKINDLFYDLRDGTNLIALLEVLTKTTLPKEKGVTRFHAVQNVKICLELLKKYKIKLINIHAEDIVDGNQKITLGLIWTIILYFQIASSLSDSELDIHENLTKWVKNCLEQDSIVREMEFNFGQFWSNGNAFLKILNKYIPDKLKLNDDDDHEQQQKSSRDKLELAFEIAERDFGVVKVLDVEDLVDQEYPDDKSIITYVSMLHDALTNHQQKMLNSYQELHQKLKELLNEGLNRLEIDDFTLEDLHTFQLKEYNEYLKYRKRLKQLNEDLNRLYNGQIPIRKDYEYKIIDALWNKFEFNLKLRLNQVEEQFKTQEQTKILILKINKFCENCLKKCNDIEKEFREINQKRDKSNQALLNDKLKALHDDVQKMHEENLKLKKLNQIEFKLFNKRLNGLQNLIQTQQANMNQAQQNSYMKSLSSIKSNTIRYLNDWIKLKNKQLDKLKIELNVEHIEKDLALNKKILNEVENFKDKIVEARKTIVNLNKSDLSIDSCKYELNELEYSYDNLNETVTKRQKSLELVKEFLTLVNDELYFLDQKEEIELSRDWSMPEKLDSFELTLFKNRLDNELKKRQNNLERIKEIVKKTIKQEQPSILKNIQIYIDTLDSRWQWIYQLTYLLDVHINDLKDYEEYQSNYSTIEKWLELKSIQISKVCEYNNNNLKKDQIELILKEIKSYKNKIDYLIDKSKQIKAFNKRRQLINSNNVKCKSLINYRQSSLFQIEKNELCYLIDTKQKTKWKIKNNRNQSALVPSVCLILLDKDLNLIKKAEKLKFQFNNLLNLIENYLKSINKLMNNNLNVSLSAFLVVVVVVNVILC